MLRSLPARQLRASRTSLAQYRFQSPSDGPSSTDQRRRPGPAPTSNSAGPSAGCIDDRRPDGIRERARPRARRSRDHDPSVGRHRYPSLAPRPANTTAHTNRQGEGEGGGGCRSGCRARSEMDLSFKSAYTDGYRHVGWRPLAEALRFHASRKLFPS